MSSTQDGELVLHDLRFVVVCLGCTLFPLPPVTKIASSGGMLIVCAKSCNIDIFMSIYLSYLQFMLVLVIIQFFLCVGGGGRHLGLSHEFSHELITHLSGLQLIFMIPKISAFPPVTKIASDGAISNEALNLKRLDLYMMGCFLLCDSFTIVYNSDAVGWCGFFNGVRNV